MTKVKGSRGYKSQKECGSKQNIFFFKLGLRELDYVLDQFKVVM